MGPILVKTGIVCATSVAGLWAMRSSSLHATSERSFLICCVLLQVSIALAFFFGLFVAGHQQVTSDVPAYYLPAARAVLAGQVPFEDFQTSYAPLFPWVGAGILSGWNDARAFVLFDIGLNALTLLLWHPTAVACAGRRTARTGTILYATSGHLLVQTLLGTNQLWIATALAAGVSLLVRDRSTGSGLVQAAGACATKFLALLFWPVLWICAPARMRWLAGAVPIPLIVYGAFAAGGADVLYPLRHEGALITSGNIPYLSGPLIPAAFLRNSHLLDALTLSALGICIAWLFWNTRDLLPRQRPLLLFQALVLVGSVFLLVSKKSFTGYAVFFLYPAFVVLVHGAKRLRTTLLFGVIFNLVLAVEPSVWFHLGGNGKDLQEWLPGAGLLRAAAFMTMEAALLTCYVYLAYLSVCSLRHTVSGATSPSTDSHSRTA